MRGTYALSLHCVPLYLTRLYHISFKPKQRTYPRVLRGWRVVWGVEWEWCGEQSGSESGSGVGVRGGEGVLVIWGCGVEKVVQAQWCNTSVAHREVVWCGSVHYPFMRYVSHSRGGGHYICYTLPRSIVFHTVSCISAWRTLCLQLLRCILKQQRHKIAYGKQ